MAIIDEPQSAQAVATAYFDALGRRDAEPLCAPLRLPPAQGLLGDAAGPGHLDAALQERLGVLQLREQVPAIRVHPDLGARAGLDRGGLPAVVGVRVRADHEPDVVHAQPALAQSQLQVLPGVRVVHARVDEQHPAVRRDRPCVAVRHARPRQRQPKPPHAGHDLLAASHLPSSFHRT